MIALVLSCCLQYGIHSQEYKFGKVSKEVLEEKAYPLDSTSVAAYLYKKQRTYFDFIESNSSFQLVTEVSYRLKIYKKEGFDYATTEIVIYAPDSGDDERVSSIKGYTFNLENGAIKKEKLAKSSVFKEKLNKYRKVVKITSPSIKEGSVIDLQYKIFSPYATSLNDLKFQYGIPVKELDYSVSIPEYYKFKLHSKGYFSIIPQRTSKTGSIFYNKITFETEVYNFKQKNIPALKDDEPYVSNINNYRGGMKFELSSTDFLRIGGDIKYYTTTWEDVAKQIYNVSSFGSELEKENYYKKDLDLILANISSPSQKMLAILQFVKSKVAWNDYYGKYTSQGVRKAYKDGVGNVAEINLMLTSMLRYAGLNANPVLVSTKSHGVFLFPTLDGFNYVISMIEFNDGSYALLDATEPYSTPNGLPTRTLNWNGRKVSKDGRSSWISLTPPKKASVDKNVMVTINDDLSANGSFRIRYDHLNALNYRVEKSHIKNEVLQTNLEEKYKIEIEDFRISNKKELYKPVTNSIKFSSEDLVEEINDKLYINPLLFFTKTVNPFKSEERNFPVDFVSPWKETNRITITLPEGYQVASLPEPLAIGLPEDIGVFKFQVSQQGNKIYTIAILQINKAVVSSPYYQYLKKFYADMIQKQSEKIVLATK